MDEVVALGRLWSVGRHSVGLTLKIKCGKQPSAFIKHHCPRPLDPDVGLSRSAAD
jgi:hypothetical protein